MLLLAGFLLSAHVFAGNYADVSVMDAKIMIDQKPSLVILDVRNQSEYDARHIRNAKLIPVWQLAARLNELNMNDEIVVYCGSGARSVTASLTLSDNGFTHVYNMLGGITAWINASYPVYVKYASLQATIDNATQGSTINVSSGTYNESLTINKPLTLVGENKSTTIIDALGNGNVVQVSSENVTITGFTIQVSGCSCSDYAGIYARSGSTNLNVTGNVITQNGYSIKIVESSNSTITYNEITGNSNSVELTFSDDVLIVGNTIVGNTYGLDLNPSSDDTITGNNISMNTFYNLMSRSSNANTFKNNTIALSNSGPGIRHYSSHNDTFIGNIVQSNVIGIDFQNSSGNVFYQNSFVHNTWTQLQFAPGEPVTPNTWDAGNINGGNYWSNYRGIDSNADGIGDSPQILDSGNKDNYPLMGVFSTFTSESADNVFYLSSNSTIEDFRYFDSNGTIQIQVTNASNDQQTGFCRLTIPHSASTPPYTVTINDNPVNCTTLYEDDTTSTIYFAYHHSTLEIDVVPEYSLFGLLILLSGSVMLMRVHKRNESK